MLRRRDRALHLANGLEEVPRAFEIRAKTTVQQNEQESDERNYYQILHYVLAINRLKLNLRSIVTATTFGRSIR